MSSADSPVGFRPRDDWEAAYASDPTEYYFGEQPSQLAQTALRYFLAFGGDPARASALDLGSGEGRDAVALACAGFRVTAVELAPTGLAKMDALREKSGLPAQRIRGLRADVREFPLDAESYDLTLAANIFQFLPSSEVPAQIHRLQAATKPGGICAVGVFSPAMNAWGADISEFFCAAPEELLAFFPESDGWLLLDRTEYWTYRVSDGTRASFAYIVVRKQLI